ncbi:MAG: TolB-like 6-bladed beta-propeller domain-containing protein [Bacteroidaceae bacterium]|nr:TolB-like 6-bladed beta-propeller domain-containing protein [Bacteroidaceae bacterium]
MKKLYFFVLSVLASCNPKSRDSEIFNGEIINIEDKNVVEKEVEFREMELKGVNYGFLSVCDTLAIYMNPQLPSHWYQVFNLKSGEEMGDFCMRGNGHGEFTPVGPVFNFYREANDMKTLVFESNKERASIWNITKSLLDGSTVIERSVRMPWMKENRGACFFELFIKDRNVAYGKVQSNPINDHDATLPYYQIRDLKSGEKISDIHIFERGIINKSTRTMPEVILSSSDAMKPDGSKIVQAMVKVPQLNIIDTESKQVVAYRLDYGMSLSDLETTKNLKTYFHRICADDDYIYTVYYGKEPWEGNEPPVINRIYVFDWNGRLISKITTKHCIGEMGVDNVNKILYTTSPMDEKLYYIKTDELVGALSSGGDSK